MSLFILSCRQWNIQPKGYHDRKLQQNLARSDREWEWTYFLYLGVNYLTKPMAIFYKQILIHEPWTTCMQQRIFMFHIWYGQKLIWETMRKTIPWVSMHLINRTHYTSTSLVSGTMFIYVFQNLVLHHLCRHNRLITAYLIYKMFLLFLSRLVLCMWQVICSLVCK